MSRHRQAIMGSGVGLSSAVLSGLSGVFFLAIAPSAAAQGFNDIQDHWAQTCIGNLAERDIISGYPDGSFRPEDIISRAEYAALIDQAFEDTEAERESKSFTDVSEDYWAYEAIQTTYQTGFLSGYPSGEFRPGDLVTRQEAYVALASGLDYTTPDTPEQILASTYQSATEIQDYAEAKVAAATENSIVVSPPKPQFYLRLFGASDPLTRGQMAASLCQIKGIPGVPDEYVVEASYSRSPLTNLVLAQTLRGHSRGILSVKVSPDGQTLVSGGDNTVKVWDLQTGTLDRTLRDHTDWVYSVDVSPDGRRIASGSVDGTVKIWNLQTGELLHDLTDHGDSVIEVDISPDGALVASASDDETVKLWDLGTGELLRTFEGHTAPVNAVAISPDGETVVSGSFDGDIKVWNWRRTEETELLRTLSAHGEGVQAVAIAPDGQTLVSGGDDGGIKVWNLQTGELRRTLDSNYRRVDSLAISPSGEALASGGLGGAGMDLSLMVWDLDSGTIREAIGGVASPAVDIGPDGTTLVSGSGSPVTVNEDVVIQVWKPE